MKSLVVSDVQEVAVPAVDPIDFNLYECQGCSAKSGTPALCWRCLEARKNVGSRWKGPLPLSMRAQRVVRDGDVFFDCANNYDVVATNRLRQLWGEVPHQVGGRHA
jgi:hypothetical protein